MVVDESTTIKNRKATRTKNVLMLAKDAKYKRILTGSPVTKSPMDLYAQCMFLSPEALGFSSYYAFQNRYALVQKRKMGTRAFKRLSAIGGWTNST
jgi:SNF2 family DNA or RNA helicase